MVVEGMVLFGVQHLQHGGRGIAPVVHAHFVNLIEEEQWIPDPGLGHFLQQLAGHGADVSASVPSDLGFIPDPTQRHANKLPVGGPGQ